MFEEKDDTIMARWLAGRLTEAERAEFEASSEYEEYQRLTEGLKAFKKPTYDKEALREKLWKGIENQKPAKVTYLKPLYYTLGVAASLLVLFGLFFYKVSYSTGVGEKLLVELPDGTAVNLNAKSTLKHNRFFWEMDKSVTLEGEGYFSVIKGDDFKVKTESGTVSVLGTEFNIKTRKSLFQLHCYEGRVRYDNEPMQQQSVLNAGDAIQLKGDILLEYKHNDVNPLWQSGKSSFSNTELLLVMEELKVQYGVSFDFESSLVQGHFTGTFVHDNLDLALQSVFVPMGINYELANDQKKVILNAR